MHAPYDGDDASPAVPLLPFMPGRDAAEGAHDRRRATQIRARRKRRAYVGLRDLALYGLTIASLPVILVHAVGLVCWAVTRIVALALRGSFPIPGS